MNTQPLPSANLEAEVLTVTKAKCDAHGFARGALRKGTYSWGVGVGWKRMHGVRPHGVKVRKLEWDRVTRQTNSLNPG